MTNNKAKQWETRYNHEVIAKRRAEAKNRGTRNWKLEREIKKLKKELDEQKKGSKRLVQKIEDMEKHEEQQMNEEYCRGVADGEDNVDVSAVLENIEPDIDESRN